METKPWMLNEARHKFLGIYDKMASQIVGAYEGVTTEANCEQAWLAAIEEVESREWQKQDEMLTFAREVADELGWGANTESNPVEPAEVSQ